MIATSEIEPTFDHDTPELRRAERENELVAFGHATEVVVCARCRGPIVHNEILRLSFCPVHAFAPFAFVPRTQRRL